jgi:hypothetical protein
VPPLARLDPLFKLVLTVFPILLRQDVYNARNACPDIWSYLNCNRAILANPLYTNPERVMMPPVSQLLRNVTIWADYFLRWSSAPTVPPIPLQLSQHLYSDGL